MFNLVKALYAAVLFYFLSPGVLLRLPRKGSKMVVALTHGVVFVVVFFLTYKIVLRLTGQTNEGMRGNFGFNYSQIQEEDKVRLSILKKIDETSKQQLADFKKVLEQIETLKADLKVVVNEIASSTKKTPAEIQSLKTKEKDILQKISELSKLADYKKDIYERGHKYHLQVLYEYAKFKQRYGIP